MRATRDLLRRRIHLLRTRAELLAPSQQTNSPDTRPESGKKIADNANRDGVAARVADPAVQQSMAVDLSLLGPYDGLLTALARDLVQPATAHAAPTFYRLRSLPGVGNILALVRLYAIHEIRRCPRVQECVSYCRLVKGAKESAGTRDGASSQNIGKASRKGAFSEAAVLFLRHHPAGQQELARLERRHGQGNALTVLAHQLARAVYALVKRDTAFALEKLLRE